jgi:hypothetical protein
MKGEKLYNKIQCFNFHQGHIILTTTLNEDLHPFIDNFNHTQGRYKQGSSNRIQGNTKQTIPTTISCSTVNKQGKHKLYGTPILSWHMGYFMMD